MILVVAHKAGLFRYNTCLFQIKAFGLAIILVTLMNFTSKEVVDTGDHVIIENQILQEEKTISPVEANIELANRFVYQKSRRILSDLPKNKKNLTVLYQESKDIFTLLPNEFLPDYKSFCWYDAKKKFQCLASVYLAGIPKCGTTDLFRKMMNHPSLTYQTHADGEIPKEYHYWTRSRLARNKWLFADPKRREVKESFKKFLRGTGAERVIGNKEMQIVDGTPSLLWDLAGWESRYSQQYEPPYSNGDLIRSVTPRAKIIGLLRNPIERLYSEYLYFWQQKTEVRTPKSFHDEVVKEIGLFNSCLKSKTLRSCCYSSRAMNEVKIRIELGVYVCFIDDFLSAFGSNLLVLTLEEYRFYPIETLARVFNFIEVPAVDNITSFFSENEIKNGNTDLKNKVGEILPETHKLLTEFYSPYNAMLSHLLNDSKYEFNI